MTPTPPTSTPRDAARTPQPPRPTFGEMLEEVMDLSTGLVVVLLPFILLSVPAIVLFVVLPAILLLALAVPLAVIGAMLIGPPYLLARWLRRRRRRPASPSAGAPYHAPRAARTSGQPPIRALGRGYTRP